MCVCVCVCVCVFYIYIYIYIVRVCLYRYNIKNELETLTDVSLQACLHSRDRQAM